MYYISVSLGNYMARIQVLHIKLRKPWQLYGACVSSVYKTTKIVKKSRLPGRRRNASCAILERRIALKTLHQNCAIRMTQRAVRCSKIAQPARRNASKLLRFGCEKLGTLRNHSGNCQKIGNSFRFARFSRIFFRTQKSCQPKSSMISGT